MEDMVAMLHHPHPYSSPRCNPFISTGCGWRAGGCGGSAIGQKMEEDLVHGGRPSAATHKPAAMECKGKTALGFGLAEHGVASRLPGFGNEPACNRREKPSRVSRSYSILCTSYNSDSSPIACPYKHVSGFSDGSPSGHPASFIKPMEKVLNPWIRSEAESPIQSSFVGEYFAQKMKESSASELRVDKKNMAASPRFDVNQVQEGMATATSPTSMKEAMERAALKIKLTKQARDGAKEKEKESNVVKPRDYREKNKKIYEEGGRERNPYDKCEIHQKKQQEREGRKTEDRECLYKGRDIGIEKGREWEKHREGSEWVIDGTIGQPESLGSTIQKTANNKGATAEIAVHVVTERKRMAVGQSMAEGKIQEDHEAVDRMMKEAEGALLRAEVEKAAAKARERAERVVAAVRKQQQANENDLSSLFMGNSQTRSISKQKCTTMDAMQNIWQENKTSSNGRQQQGAFSGEFGTNRKVSVTSSADDHTSLFNSSKFQGADGETPDYRGARRECYQHMQDRVAKALQEKNQRDLQNEMEQAERYRASEMLDPTIKCWAAGKEGNLYALLSNLHLILWPECGWQPISMMDLISAESVKKSYRKATLCVHPDKLQQKGTTIQQKYLAEKVFDLLKDAWNKFQS